MAIANFFSLILTIINSVSNPPYFPPFPAYQTLHITDGSGLYQKQIAGGNIAYLQVINLSKMQIEQIAGEVDNLGVGQGKYYRGENKYKSPFFKMKLFSEVTAEYQQVFGDRVFSVINCAFFEQYKSSTQLSFPIKLNGEVITGGSSPYGPIERPQHEFYKNIRLKALVWNDKEAYISDFDPNTGAPLNDPKVGNAIVSYQYNHHPAKIIGKNEANKYHVLGTLNKDGIPGDELLLIVTVNKATLDEAANLLRELGVEGDIITIDGGSSTYLFNSQMGNIILPTPTNSFNNLLVRHLPHYLGFRYRGNRQ